MWVASLGVALRVRLHERACRVRSGAEGWPNSQRLSSLPDILLVQAELPTDGLRLEAVLRPHGVRLTTVVPRSLRPRLR